ncbi:MAG: PQQ-binding-like beta-propeller repeat protein, partial [Roseibacillus sp.]|nr:PQQ-binding-like beta-propeller repeat protein [Roseibacillus sp.]
MNPPLLFARCPRILGLFLATSLGALGQEGPIHEWRFAPGSVQGGKLRAAVGNLRGEMIGEYRLEREGELQFMRLLPSARNLKVGGILLSQDIEETQLPTRAMTVEAWVQIDRSIEWGGILGAVHDTGSHERGWILGYGDNQFYFGLVAEKPARITYLRASGNFVTGAWYHVAASYDGNEMRLYVDGQLSSQHTGQSGRILQPESPFFTIGAYRDDNDYYPFSGKLERITLWHRALPAEELAKRFAKRKNEFPGIEETVVARTGGPSDWTTWMGDNARSGRAGEALPALSQEASWVHIPSRKPAPAWPETALSDYWRNRLTPEVPRVTFDWIHSVVVSDGRLFYGSSADDSLRCLDATTGKEQWSFIAGGPIRLAPTVMKNTVLFGCDDGAVYCLDARSGALRWKARPPSARDERLPGNGRLISLWPVRTGVLVKDDAAYFGAGLFPAEGCWQCAV